MSANCQRLRPTLLASCAVLAAGLFAALCPAQRRQVQLAEPNPGTGAFQYILATQGLTPLTRPEQLRTSPSRTLLIVLGSSQVLHQVPDGIDTFLDRGGALLLATDQNSRHNTWDTLRVAVDGWPVQTKDFAYRGVKDCPIITRFDREHPLFQNVERIATNRPSYVVSRDWPPVLARFPNPSLVNDRELKDMVFAVTGGRYDGQYLLLADHSVFIDGMILQKDNDNFTFAYNCVNWLRQGAKQERDRALLVVDGRIVTDFGTPIPYLPRQIPAPDLDKALMTLEERNAFDRFVLNLVPVDRLFRFALVLLSVGLVGYVLYRLARARHRVEQAAPLFAVSLAQAMPGKSVIELRQESTLEGGNLWEPARALAQQFFAAAAPQGREFTGPPTVALPASGARQRGWTRLLCQLWQLAHATSPARISPRRFRRLLADLEVLRAALADGSVTLRSPG